MEEGGNGHFYDAVETPAGCELHHAFFLEGSGPWSDGYLVTITSDAENSWIWENLGDLRGFRLGGIQPDGGPEPAGGWYWVSGEPWDYTNWGENEPNNAGGDEQTLIYLDFSLTGEWNDAEASVLCPGYVVEYDSLEPLDPVLWPIQEGGNGHFYLPVPVSGGCTWERALALADGSSYQGTQGYLATLTSESENAWVWSQFGPIGGYRIGAYQPAGSVEPDQGWTWVTGESWSFAGWDAGEPNNAGDESTIEFLLSATAGEWNDTSESTTCPGLVLEFQLGASPAVPASWTEIKALFRKTE